MKPSFITLDGIDGSGKSTHLATIENWFAERNLPVLFTREPGGTPLEKACAACCSTPRHTSACAAKPC